jgi:hypothetical protein
MNAKNHCIIGWHLQRIKHYNIVGVLIFKDFRICYSIFLFRNFQFGFFPVGWENNILFTFGNMTEYRL